MSSSASAGIIRNCGSKQQRSKLEIGFRTSRSAKGQGKIREDLLINTAKIQQCLDCSIYTVNIGGFLKSLLCKTMVQGSALFTSSFSLFPLIVQKRETLTFPLFCWSPNQHSQPGDRAALQLPGAKVPRLLGCRLKLASQSFLSHYLSEIFPRKIKPFLGSGSFL